VTRPLRKLAHDPGDMQITSHCPFCGSGQVIGRSDGNIECEFCGMTYLVRIQPMFTGMPQQPMGAGFGGPSSEASDLMSPGMIDPETGMPLDPGMADPELAMEENEAGVPFGSEGGEEMPPDEEEELAAGPPGTQGSEDGGGFPPGEDEELPPGEEGEEDAPPWAADEEGGGEDSGPPPEAEEKNGDKKKDKKDKKNKKESSFRKSAGQWRYTELLDHMAAPREAGGHGLDREGVSRVGHDSRKLQHLHSWQHSFGKNPGHEHHGEFEGPADTRVAARYRTIAGDWLPEDAYIRHLACLHGGIEAVKLRRAS
jgi:hypothetical protein